MFTAGRVDAAAWTVEPGGISIAVRLTPKGGRDAIDGIEHLPDGRSVLKMRVRAAPSDGEANAALIKFLARALGVPPRALSLTAGATARIKRLKVTGDAAMLAQRLAALVAESAGAKA